MGEARGDNRKLEELERQLASTLKITEKNSQATDSCLPIEENALILYGTEISDSSVNFNKSTKCGEESSKRAVLMNKVYETLLQNQERENEELKLQLLELQRCQTVNGENCTIEKVTAVRISKTSTTIPEIDLGNNRLSYEDALKALTLQEKSLNNLKHEISIKQEEFVKAEQRFCVLQNENENLCNVVSNLQKEMAAINGSFLIAQKENEAINEELEKLKNYSFCFQQNMENVNIYKDKIAELNFQLQESIQLNEQTVNRYKQLKDLHEKVLHENFDVTEHFKRNVEEKTVLLTKVSEMEKHCKDKDEEIEKLQSDAIDNNFAFQVAKSKLEEFKKSLEGLLNKSSGRLNRDDLNELVDHFDGDIALRIGNIQPFHMEGDGDIRDFRDDSPDSIVEVYNSKADTNIKQKRKLLSVGHKYRSRSTSRNPIDSKYPSEKRHSHSPSDRRRRRRSVSNPLKERSQSRGRSRHRSRIYDSKNRHCSSLRNSIEGDARRTRNSSSSSKSSSSFHGYYSSDRRRSVVLKDKRTSNDRIVLPSQISPTENYPLDDGTNQHTSSMFPSSSFSSTSSLNQPIPNSDLLSEFNGGRYSGLSIITKNDRTPVTSSKNGNLVSTTVEGAATIPIMLHIGNPGANDESSPGNFIQKYTISVQKNVPGYHHGSHPVKELDQQCIKHNWLSPTYVIDKKCSGREQQYFCDVKVNGRWFKPQYGSTCPRDAQCLAAIYCLQQLGIPV